MPFYLCPNAVIDTMWFHRDHFVYAPSQWKTTLHCYLVSHWLDAYTKLSLILYTVSYNPTRDFNCGYFVEKLNIIMGFDCICNFDSRPLLIWHIACWNYLGFILKALKFKSTGNLSSLEYKFEAHELMPMDMWNSINHKCIHTKENVKMLFILDLSSNFFMHT